MDSITIKLNIPYNDIEEVKKTTDRKTIIVLKSGQVLTFSNGQAKRIFNKLRRNYPGENLD